MSTVEVSANRVRGRSAIRDRALRVGTEQPSQSRLAPSASNRKAEF